MMRLRFAVPADAEALLAIYRPYVEKTSISFETEVPSPAEFSHRIADFSKTYPYLVVEENGAPLGYAYAHAFHERAAYDWTVETSIYIAENARGKHIGTTLYGALLKLLTLQGVKNACAVVTFPNIPSTAFHQAMGFDAAGVLPDFGYKLGNWHSVAYLFKVLGNTEDAPAPVVPCSELDPARVAEILQGDFS